MFRATFIGHQGWMVSTHRTRILIDPLLTDAFGHGGAVGTLYPPRRLDLAAFPPIDGVILTHEHDDHFDVPSLHRLDRRVPVWLSARSSVAAHALLHTMGFADIRRLRAGETEAIGDLRYRTFAPDHTGGATSDEWDVFPFVVFDTQGHGSMASSVDVPPTPEMLGALGRLAPRPGLWCHANNATSAAFADMLGTTASAHGDADLIARAVTRRHARVCEAWGVPAATLVCGGGWSYSGDRAWLNHNAFPVPCASLATDVATRTRGAVVRAPAPGESFTMIDGALAELSASTKFLGTPLPACWPARDFRGDVARMPSYAPACGHTSLTKHEYNRLLRGLKCYAGYLYGRALFRALHSLPSAAGPEGREAAICFALLGGPGGDPCVLRYDPTSCAFVAQPDHRTVASAVEGFAGGIECWASDLLGVLEGTLGPSALCNAGRLRTWNHRPAQIRASAHDLWNFAHPLRRPAQAAALYASLLRAQPTTVARIPARGR